MSPRGTQEAEDRSEEHALVLHEEELHVGTAAHEYGAIRARKTIEAEEVSELLPRKVEQAQVDRVAANDADSGQIETLPDGSISIPLLEEELVVTKRIVVRERIVVRKETATEQAQVSAQLRREQVEISHPAAETNNEGG